MQVATTSLSGQVACLRPQLFYDCPVFKLLAALPLPSSRASAAHPPPPPPPPHVICIRTCALSTKVTLMQNISRWLIFGPCQKLVLQVVFSSSKFLFIRSAAIGQGGNFEHYFIEPCEHLPLIIEIGKYVLILREFLLDSSCLYSCFWSLMILILTPDVDTS